MDKNIIKDNITGSRNLGSIITMIVLFLGSISFLLTGISSYLNKDLINSIDNLNEIKFMPQGIVMLFYASLGLGISLYLLFTIIYDIGSGYNEFSKEEKIIRIIRKGFPGKNKLLLLTYRFNALKAIKFVNREGLNPRYNVLLILKDKREIPLFPAQFLFNPIEMEKKAILLANFLNIPLENVKL